MDAAGAALAALARDDPDAALLVALEWLHGRWAEIDAFMVRLRAGPSNPVLRRVLTQRPRPPVTRCCRPSRRIGGAPISIDFARGLAGSRPAPRHEVALAVPG